MEQHQMINCEKIVLPFLGAGFETEPRGFRFKHLIFKVEIEPLVSQNHKILKFIAD